MTSTAVELDDYRKKVQRFLYTSASGSPEFIQFIERNRDIIAQYQSKNSLYERRDYENLSEKEMLKINVDRYVHAFKLARQLNAPEEIYKRADYIFTLMGITLNTAAFLNTIELLGDEKQAATWREMVLNGKAFGGYGQTELGHGSNVQGLETEAHYDEKKQVFRLISPKVTSAKFWPGVLGAASTHVVLQAKTFVKGKPIGIQTFVFETRDQNLKPIKGVEAGDIGPKFGFHRVDNGYLLIKEQTQIPRDWMLMKYVQVTPEGEVLGLENKEAIKYAYGSMLYLRVALPFNFAFSHVITPARQLLGLYEKMGVSNEPSYRKELINYFSVGQGIIVANLFAFKLFNIFSQELKSKNYEKADKVLAKCHIVSATFKALTSWKALRVSTQIATRNQYTPFRTTGLPYAFNNIVPAVTYEGDNSVLLQQTAKFILMKDKGEELTRPGTLVRDDDLEGIIKVLKYVTSMEIRRLKKLIQEDVTAKVGFKTIWNEKHQREIIDVSYLWGVRQLLQGYADSLRDITELKSYFTKVGKVFAKNLISEAPQIFTYGFQVQQTESWKEFSEIEYYALSHIERPIAFHEEQKLLPREGVWLRSKL